jgi:hypothetical protein
VRESSIADIESRSFMDSNTGRKPNPIANGRYYFVNFTPNK